MFNHHKSHELKSSTRCTNCGDDFVKLAPQRAQTLPHEEVRYYLKCSRCQSFRYGTETWDLASALAIIEGESWGAINALEPTNDEPLDLSERRETVIKRIGNPLSQGMKMRMPSPPSSATNSQRPVSPQPGPSSGLVNLGIRGFRPDLIYTIDSDSDEDLTQTRPLNQDRCFYTVEQPYKCEFCGKIFAWSYDLTSHRRCHIRKKPYQCDECGKTFTQIGHLKNHQRIHTGEKPYQCDERGKTFTQISNLKKHQRIHSGERPFKCDICGRGFTWQSNLKVHLRTHTAERPYF